MGEVAGRLAPPARSHDGAMILTDDRAPVELLGMHAIDELIAQQARPYQEGALKGIQGLLELQ